ncbi:large exoprotein [Microbacterium sp. C7(2022)]|uniref:large exoprotein n=1 Tax=Microbacterium sp. C7(2022) TaxID=2992759 RepID=UPI00237AD326|nr:large exoprotein [Microbacterium sp. C7(2022)]MDE0547216.1 large exoprotein [Microbacterium sp. C7(2022)]
MEYDYGYGGLVALWLVLIPLLLIFALAGYIIGAIFLMKLFEKAGVQGKWRAWVPVYNTMIFAKLGDLSPWVMLGAVAASALLGQIPAIGWILSLAAVAAGVMAGWRIGLKLSKDWPLLLLWIIPGIGTLIWLGILAFGRSTWNPSVAPAPWANSFLKDTTVWDGIPVQAGAAPAPGAYPPPAGAYPPPAPGAYPPAAANQPPAPPAAPPVYQPPAAEPPVAPPPAAEPPSTSPATEPPATEPPANEPPKA